MEEGTAKNKAALIVTNWNYERHSTLKFPERDGEILNDMLTNSGYCSVKVVHNSINIFEDIENFVDEMRNKQPKEKYMRVHFHFSGKQIPSFNLIFLCFIYKVMESTMQPSNSKPKTT